MLSSTDLQEECYIQAKMGWGKLRQQKNEKTQVTPAHSVSTTNKSINTDGGAKILSKQTGPGIG